jgi:hypothetical protein
MTPSRLPIFTKAIFLTILAGRISPRAHLARFPNISNPLGCPKFGTLRGDSFLDIAAITAPAPMGNAAGAATNRFRKSNCQIDHTSALTTSSASASPHAPGIDREPPPAAPRCGPPPSAARRPILSLPVMDSGRACLFMPWVMLTSVVRVPGSAHFLLCIYGSNGLANPRLAGASRGRAGAAQASDFGKSPPGIVKAAYQSLPSETTKTRVSAYLSHIYYICYRLSTYESISLCAYHTIILSTYERYQKSEFLQSLLSKL